MGLDSLPSALVLPDIPKRLAHREILGELLSAYLAREIKSTIVIEQAYIVLCVPSTFRVSHVPHSGPD